MDGLSRIDLFMVGRVDLVNFLSLEFDDSRNMFRFFFFFLITFN